MELREKIECHEKIASILVEVEMKLISVAKGTEKLEALSPQWISVGKVAKAPRVTISEIKLYRPENDVAFHNELMDLLDKYIDEYRIDWDFELPQPPKEGE